MTTYTWPREWHKFISSQFALRTVAMRSEGPLSPRRNTRLVYQIWTAEVASKSERGPSLWAPKGAFFSRLDGEVGRFRFSDTLRCQPAYNRGRRLPQEPWSDDTLWSDNTGWLNAGYVPPTAELDAAAQAGDDHIVIRGLPPGAESALTAGDLLEIRPNGIPTETSNLYEVVRGSNAAPFWRPPYFSIFTSTLDGRGGLADAVDISRMARPMTFVGTAELDYVTKWAGASSLRLYGSGDRLQMANTPDLAFAAGEPFTLHCRARTTNNANGQFLFGKWNSAGNNRSWVLQANYTSGILQLARSSDGAENVAISTSGGALSPSGVWQHCAVTRDAAGNVYIFVDGVLLGTGTYTGAFYNSTAGLAIGAATNGANSFVGNIDQVEVLKGVCVWTNSFVPPTDDHPLLSEVTGVAGVEIRPRLRQPFASGDMVVLHHPQGVFQLTDSEQGRVARDANMGSFGFAALEYTG